MHFMRLVSRLIALALLYPTLCFGQGVSDTPGSGGGGSGGITLGAAITGVCPNRQVFFSTAGVIGCEASSGTGTVTTLSVVTANGVSGSVTNPTTTPAITLSLGSIVPTTVNGNTLTTGTGTLTLGSVTLNAG